MSGVINRERQAERRLSGVTAKQLEVLAAAMQLRDFYTFTDAPGLRLVAGKTSRTWVHRYESSNGKLVAVKIGRYPDYSLADAISKVQANNRARNEGQDPALDRRRQRELQRQAVAEARIASYTVGTMVEDYLETIERSRKERGARECVRLLRKEIPQTMRVRPATAITSQEAAALVLEIHARAPAIARGFRFEMSAAFEQAQAIGRIPESAGNPWHKIKRNAAVKKLLKPGKRSRHLTDAEIATFQKWLPTSRLSRTVRDTLSLTLLLGMRSGEVIAGRWSDVDLDRGTWTLPSTKTDAPRTIRLPRQAIALLRSRRPLGETFIFPRRGDREHVTQHAIAWALNGTRNTSGLAEFTPHDLRRTCRTGLSRLGCPHEVAEAALGHTRGGIAGVYDLHRYESEVGAWLQTWADHLDALASPAVVPFNAERIAS